VKLPDETVLRQRLYEELDPGEISPAPVAAVFRRSRTVRARRLALITSGVAVIAAAVSVLAVLAPGRTLPTPNGPAGGRVFASGTANGRVWRLAAVNLADPGYRCLPGIVVNGQDGDLLQPGFLPGLTLGDVAFLAVYPGRPSIGFAFLQLRPGVSSVTAHLGDRTRLGLRPVTVTVCGQQFRLAGFEYPRQGVTRITARSAQGRPISYTPLADYFNPASPLQTGTWVNVQGAAGNVAAGEIGSGTIGGTPWRMKVTLGPDGECFTSQIGPAGPGFAASICVTVGAPPKGASLTPLPYGAAVIWYAGTANSRTTYLLAHLSNGTTSRLVPAVVGGRKYFVLAVADRVKLTRLTLYDTHRHVLADITSIPRISIK
jgi:hypothetical protein